MPNAISMFADVINTSQTPNGINRSVCPLQDHVRRKILTLKNC